MPSQLPLFPLKSPQSPNPPLPKNILVFASGSNRVEEIEGFTRIGIPVGVSAQHLNEDAIRALFKIDGYVMVDSGAFSEVRVTSRGLEVVAPISHIEWRRRLDLYRRLAIRLGSKALFVVPDRVGDQQETLRRLATYRSDLLALAELGAWLLLPLQVGALSHAAFYSRAAEVASVRMIPAMPMRKAATSVTGLVSFLESVQSDRIHLLGAGIETRRARKIVKFLLTRYPALSVSMDSNRLRAVIGKGRPLTRREVQLRDQEIEGLYGSVASEALSKFGRSLDYTDLIAFPSSWADTLDLLAIAQSVSLTPDETEAFLREPDRFLQRPIVPDEDESTGLVWIEHPVVSDGLDRAWERFVSKSIRSCVRTVAIADGLCTFSDRQPGSTPCPFSLTQNSLPRAARDHEVSSCPLNLCPPIRKQIPRLSKRRSARRFSRRPTACSPTACPIF